jgi:HAD superfamily hydrolase (TIGR01509 family)
MEPRAYFTDLGGCLFPDFLDTACGILAARYAITAERIEEARKGLWNIYAYAKGVYAPTTAQAEKLAWASFAAEAGIDASPEEIVAVTAECVRPLDPEYVALLERLKKRGVVLGIISNNTEFFWERQRQALKLERFFPSEHVFLSCDYGAPKNSREQQLFQAALAAASVPPEACIFVDDRVHNIECALQAGFGMAILHPKSITWGAKYIAQILTQTGVLPSVDVSAEYR